MRTRITGRLLSVSESPIGTTLAADAAAGATSITVDDASVFDETGGSLYIGAQVAKYSSYDDDNGIITLADALTDAADTDDPVSRWSTLYGEVETAQSAQVAVEGDRDQADTLTAEISDALDLPSGDRGGDGENCVLELDGDVWTVISVRGRPSKARGPRHEPNDPHTLTTGEITAGLFTQTLKHSGIAYDRAIVCCVNGIAYAPDQLAVDSTNGVVSVTLGGWETVDDAIWFDYWYRKGTVAPDISVPPPTPTRITIDSTFQHGWPGNSSDTTYTLTGLQTGDLVVAALRSSSTTMDSRFSVVCDLGSVSGSGGPFYGKVWAATIGADVSNVTFPHAGTVLRLRNATGTPLRMDSSRVVLPDGTHTGGAGSIAALPGGGSGAISAILTGAFIGGAYGTVSYPAPWDSIDGTTDTDGGTYGLVYLTWTTAETVGAIAAPQHYSNSGCTWRGCALGIGYA